jgi:hypothetical protein
LKEAQNVLLNLARYRPSNFGISTGILMHMIRATCHSPIVKLKYLNDALRDVRFEEIMDDYGMFFLHDLDLEHHCILGIPSTDPVACKEAMSRNGKGHKPLMVAPPPSSGPSGLYPIGDSPAWAEIKAFIGRGAQTFMYAWVWDPDWDGVHEIAAQLFVRFSREYFVTLKDDALRADAPSPTCLKEAMEAWAVVELSNTLVSCWFVASNHGLKGNFPGARSLSFRDHARMFFPTTPDHILNSAWSPFLQHGYIGRYLRELEKLDDDDDRQSLTDAIADIFGRLHCLPVIVTPTQRSKGRIWTTSHEGIHLLTNPMFYKLKRVGGPKADARVAANRLQRVKASNAVINKRLIQMNGGGAASAADAKRARKVARDRMKRLSTKSKNKRRPPDRWGKQKKVISPVDSDEEQEKEPDEEEQEEENSDEQEESNGEDQEETDYDDMQVDESEEDGDEDDYDMEV